VPFSAPYDLTTKIISAIVCIGLLCLALAIHAAAIGVLALLVLGVAYAYSPRGYVCSGQSIAVKRLIGDVEVPLVDVREARAATKDDFRGCIRLWGNGGLFGYYGLFRTSKLGKCTWYVTSRSNAVVVVTSAKTVLFSPDDVNSFLAAIGTLAPVSPGPQIPPAAGLPRSSRMSFGAIAGIVIAVAVVAFVLFAVLYSPGPPKYTLNEEGLAIHDLFYPVTLKAADIDAGRMATVSFAADPEWRPVARTNGFSNSHYHSGWYRVANGNKVRMYWANGARLVLLPPRGEGVPVLIEVGDPQRFIEDARRLWSRP
jgi:hypothetical protein